MKKQIIITADDYGMCKEVDRAIDDCIEAGLLTSTNVILNMGDLEAAKTLRTRFPQISIGLHWNVTDGKPLTDARSLINPATGNFWNVSQFIQGFKNGTIDKEELRKELIVQYKQFISICKKADYWNVHMNSSLDFKTFPFFNSLALELGISKTRSFRRVYIKPNGVPGGIRGQIIEFAKKNVMDIWFGYQIPKTGTKMPDGRIMYFNKNDKTSNIDNIGKNIQWNNKDLIELVIHPAITADHPSFGDWKEVRVAEWKMFTSPTTKKYLSNQCIELVNFDAIK